MASSLSRRFRHVTGLLGLVAALVAQLALGAVVRPDEAAQAQRAALDAVITLCQPGTADDHKPPRRSHDLQTALCPLSMAFAQSGALLTPSAILPVPTAVLAFHGVRRPPARAPPARVFAASYPRGPPHLV